MNHAFEERYFAARRKYIESQFQDLTPMQRTAALTTEGPLLRLAGAGSGKTTVLINRIANLIRFGSGYESRKVPFGITEADVQFLETQPIEDRRTADELCAEMPVYPNRILAITFTNKAANELKERLERMLEKIALRQAIAELPERENCVISLRYFHGLPQDRVAKVLDVSQVQVSRNEKTANGLLREKIGE